MNWKLWAWGFGAAMLSGAVDAALLTMVAPSVFATEEGLKTLLMVCAFFGAKAGLMYLKNHPPAPPAEGAK